jgi:hypothetical protein
VKNPEFDPKRARFGLPPGEGFLLQLAIGYNKKKTTLLINVPMLKHCNVMVLRLEL